MCDLNSQEKTDLLAALAEINTLAQRINEHATSIDETAYMDHEGLAALLADLRDKAGASQQWVANKPHEHAGHHG
jgi:hypothetical protein